jgi:hypothetical protein
MLGLVLLFSKNVGDRLGPELAITSLVVVVAYWGVLMFAHYRAEAHAFEQATLVAGKDEKISRLAAMPTLANPFGWDCVFETDKAPIVFTSRSELKRQYRESSDTKNQQVHSIELSRKFLTIAELRYSLVSRGSQ